MEIKIGMKVSFILIYLLLLNSCYYRFDDFYYQKDSYTLYSEKINYNGYYFYYEKFEDSSDSLMNTIFFFQDGSVLYGLGFENHNQMIYEFNNYPESDWGIWGKYAVIGDSVLIEVVQPDEYKHKMEIIKNKFYIKNSDSLQISKEFDVKVETWYCFKASILRPDSTLNWVKEHRKYRQMW